MATLQNFKYTTAKKPGATNGRVQFSTDYDTQRENVLSFDGTNDKIGVADSSDFDVTSVTVSAWVKLSEDPDNLDTLLSRQTGSPNQNPYMVDIKSDKTVRSLVYTSSQSNLSTTNSLVVGNWTLVTMTYDNSDGTHKIYLNGVEDASQSVISGNLVNVNTYFGIGARLSSAGSADRFFPGDISDVRVYGEALSPTDILALYENNTQPDDTNLEGHWKLDEGTGTTATDSSTNSNDGTITGASWETDTDFAHSQANWKNKDNVTIDNVGAYDFDGVDDWIDIGSTSQTVKAIRFLVKATQATSESIIDFDAGTHTISTDVSDQITATGFSTPTYYVDGIPGDRIITDDTWHSVTIKTATGFTASDLDIGRISSAYFGGSIGRVVLYDTEPTDDMVWNEYAYAVDANSANIVGDWKFNGNALDSSVNGNDGTVTGAVNTTDWNDLPQIGHSFLTDAEAEVAKFDDVDDWVDVGDTGSTIKSISFDINLDEATSESIIDLDGGTHTISTNASDQITATGFTTPTYYVDGVSGDRVVTNGGWHKVLITTATGIDVNNLDFGRIASAYMGGKIANVAMWTDVRTSGEATTDFENGWIDTTDGAIAHYWKLAGAYTDSVGSADGTNNGTVFIKDLLRPQPEEPVQQSIDISALGDSNTFVYRTFFEGESDRTFALDEITLEYLSEAGAGRVILMRRRF